MAASEIRSPIPVRVITALLALLLAGFLLLFGVANLIHPEVPTSQLTLNTVICLVACALGVASLLVAAAIVRELVLGKRGA